MTNQVLTPQQQMVLDEKKLTLSLSTATGEHLDGKAAIILQAGGVITAIVGAVSLPTFVYNPTTWWQLGALSLAFATFGGMLLAALRAWQPSVVRHPGSTNWQEQFDTYIHEDVDTCYKQVLCDVIYAIERSVDRNATKSWWVTFSIISLGVQIVAVLALAIATAV